ncbi:MAG: T9SS type A sorting domain-containing protein [Williamsia sp.]|nr:T9SS type A sorting domain-containing protein [Williamsia sp.]
MKRILLLGVTAVLLLLNKVGVAQNVFNPNDIMVDYDSLHPPVTPASNTLAKWVRSRKMTWNTDRFKSYYYNGMAFRLRYPNNYNPSDPTKKYPLVLFLHGGGEIAPPTDNEIHLLHTGETFQTMIDQGQYDAFLLYPLVSENDIWQEYHFLKVNNILDSLQKYCFVDQDKVMVMGLSMGAFGAMRYSAWYPHRSSMAAGASPALIEAMPSSDRDRLLHLPLWVGNGGLDVNPAPSSVQGFVSYITSKGGNIRQDYYPDLAHPTWGPMYNPTIVLPYWQTAHKANPVVFFGRTQFDQDTAVVNDRLGITPGFYQYEWQRNGVTIASAINGVKTVNDPSVISNYDVNEITVKAYGSYRVRFKRTSSAAWSEWSPNPVVIYSGLKYRYYQGSWNSLPDFNSLTPVASGTTPNISINTRPVNSPTDNYGFIWEGKIWISTPGTYTFETVSDDGSKLYFNTTYSSGATALVNNDGTHPAQSATGTVNVQTPGYYPIVITFFEKDGGESMQAYWSGPGFSRQLIPDSAFSRAVVTNDITPPTAPANLQTVYVGRTFADLSWSLSTDNVGVSKYDVYVNGVYNSSTSTPGITVSGLTPNSSYNFTVKAVDQAGNASVSSNAVSATASANGLRYKYYEGVWSNLPNFTGLTPKKIGSMPAIDINPRTANDTFAFVWEGYINITTPGSYTFETASDDGSKLYFNTFYSSSATALVNNDGLHGTNTAGGTVNIPSAGLYPITITYFEREGGESMQVYWTGPGIARQLIPASAFVEGYQDNVPPSAPANIKSTYTGRTFVDLAWDNSTDNVGVSRYDVYMNGSFKMSTTTPSASISGLTGGSSYTFAVRAADQAGNVSAMSNALSLTASANGLRYKYYHGSWSTVPDFSALTPVKTGTSANVDLSPRILSDNFGFVWEGYINIKTPGTYTFETVSDDGSKLYFNTLYSPGATPTVNNDGLHAAQSATGTVNIASAGLYPISIAFFERDGGESMQIYWSGPGISRQLIPDAAFVESFQDNTPPSVPANLRTTFTGRTFIDLTWDASTDNGGVARYDVYVNGTFRQSTTTLTTSITGLTGGSTYSFTVKAIDQANNVSASSSALPVTASANGLRYKYYQGSWSTMPDFSTLTPLKTGSSANIDLSPRTDFDNFAFVWEGWINIKTAGTYIFETISDDGSKLYFNTLYTPSATPTVNNDGLHAPTSVSGSVNIPAAGMYPITITYFERTEGETMQIYWSGPGFSRQVIPSAAFTESFSGPTFRGVSLLSAIANVDSSLNKEKELTTAYPNPFNRDLNISFVNAAKENDISVSMYDLSGRLLYNKNFGRLSVGPHSLQLNLSGQSQLDIGNYIAQLKVNGVPVKTWKLVKTRK